VWKLIGSGQPKLGARRINPCHGLAHVIVLSNCRANQSLQLLILKNFEPSQVTERLARLRRCLVGAIDRWCLRSRWLIDLPLAHCQVAEQDDDECRNRKPSFHACPPPSPTGTGSERTTAAAGFFFQKRRLKFCIRVKLTGMIRTPRNVATSIPQNTAVPI